MGFSLILLPGVFISHYTIIYFFVNNCFSNVYVSVNMIFECSYLSFGWEIGHPLSMYITREMERGSSKMFTDAYKGREVSRFMCTYALTLSLCMFLSYGVLWQQVTVSTRLFSTWLLCIYMCIYIILDKGCHIFYVFGLNSVQPHSRRAFGLVMLTCVIVFYCVCVSNVSSNLQLVLVYDAIF